jgi:hypothetical protein
MVRISSKQVIHQFSNPKHVMIYNKEFFLKQYLIFLNLVRKVGLIV